MKSLRAVFLGAVLVGCGGSAPESEFPESDESSQEDDCSWEEADDCSSKGEEETQSPASEPNEQTPAASPDRALPAGQVASSSSASDDDESTSEDEYEDADEEQPFEDLVGSPRNLPGTNPDFLDLMLTIPEGWFVGEANLGAIAAFHRSTKTFMRVWLANTHDPQAHILELRQQAAEKYKVRTSAIDHTEQRLSFGYGPDNGKAGIVTLVAIDHIEEQMFVVVMGQWAPEHDTFARQAMGKVVYSLHLNKKK